MPGVEELQETHGKVAALQATTLCPYLSCNTLTITNMNVYTYVCMYVSTYADAALSWKGHVGRLLGLL